MPVLERGGSPQSDAVATPAFDGAAGCATASGLAEQAAHYLSQALRLLNEPRGGQRRAQHRELHELAIARASRALLALAEAQRAHGEEARAAAALRRTSAAARSTLAQAHAAKAEDALHGAGQLSLSAQRAPTRVACDDGWRRVAALTARAEDSAQRAAELAATFLHEGPSAPARKAQAAARRAQHAALAARRITEARNDAYTFHTSSAFSFGEGWYLAAAAVLAGVSIQIEPGSGAAAAERFLHDAGLASQILPYRSRPRAMKHTTELIARAFRADASSAQRRLRAAFLGDAPLERAVREWIEQRVQALSPSPAHKVLLWIRAGVHHANRNTRYPELVELTRRTLQAGLVPILIGDALRDGPPPPGALDMILFWRDPIFRGLEMRRRQLQFFEHLRARHGLIGQVGVTTAGMDGPALMGLPTLYLTDAPNVRMGEWVGAVPGYEEVVREGDYLERISQTLSAWLRAETPSGAPRSRP